MAKNKNNPSLTTPSGKKRRWYHNIADAYKVTKRTYAWVTVAMILIPVLLMALFILLGWRAGGMIWWGLIGLTLSALADMTVLSLLLRPAMYSQLDGTVGSVYAVISQIKNGWVVEEEPVAVSKDQDLVWRLIGRPGVVLISEGPSSRVRPLLENEKKRINRIVQNAPVTFIECGNEKGQVPLTKLRARMRKLKKVLTRQEVPAVAARLTAVASRNLPIPKGVDPTNTKMSRRALRGK